MHPEEEAVRNAALRFYDAIEQMIAGEGLAPMEQAWHHTDSVTSGHPNGDWAEGWDQVWATWQVYAALGAPGRGGSRVLGLEAHVYGDVAYTTCTFVAPATAGGDRLACTNVLVRLDGEWKIVHHHADRSPALAAAMEKLASQK